MTKKQLASGKEVVRQWEQKRNEQPEMAQTETGVRPQARKGAEKNAEE